MARCPHNNVQQYTECCLDCGRNIYETDQEYYANLLERKRSQQRDGLSDRIERLERELGVNHPGNSGNIPYHDSYGPGCS